MCIRDRFSPVPYRSVYHVPPFHFETHDAVRTGQWRKRRYPVLMRKFFLILWLCELWFCFFQRLLPLHSGCNSCRSTLFHAERNGTFRGVTHRRHPSLLLASLVPCRGGLVRMVVAVRSQMGVGVHPDIGWEVCGVVPVAQAFRDRVVHHPRQ